MQFSTLIPLTLLTLASASPLMPRANNWTIQTFTRTCNDAKKTCHYSFAINDGSKATACVYDVTSTTNARRQAYQNVKCGDYVVGSSWSDQFGDNNGFQTLSVVKAKQIVWPAYADSELSDGKAVSPDKIYPVTNL